KVKLDLPINIFFLSDPKKSCVSITTDLKLNTSYYVGMDWLNEETAIYVQPKMTKGGAQTDYLKMLFFALKHPEVSQYTEELFEIKWEEKPLRINQQMDMLTP